MDESLLLWALVAPPVMFLGGIGVGWWLCLRRKPGDNSGR